MKLLPLYDEDFEILGSDLEDEIIQSSIDGLFQEKYQVKELQGTVFVFVAVEVADHGVFMTCWKLSTYIDHIQTGSMTEFFKSYRIFIVENFPV